MALIKTAVSGNANASVGTGASASKAAAGARSGPAGPGGWHPTVLYLLGMCVIEVLLVAWLSRHLLK